MKRLPKNWKQVKGATTAPNGFIWVSNNKSLFGGKRQMALIKDKTYSKDLAAKVKILGQSTVKVKDKNKISVTNSKLLCVREAAGLCMIGRQAARKASKTFNDFVKGKATAEMLKRAETEDAKCRIACWDYVQKNFSQEEITKASYDASGPNAERHFLTSLEKIVRAEQQKKNNS